MTEGDPALRSQLHKRSSESAAPIGTLLLIAAWFGIFAGLMEGAGLLLFQRINWAQWGRLMHVSKEILWISPLVDLIFFLIFTLIVWLISRFSRRIPAIRLLVLALTFLSIYDWLTVTSRLYHRACLILALGVAVAFTRWVAKREAASVRFWRKWTPWLAAVFLLAFSAIQGSKWAHELVAVASLPAASQSTPNVLVIVLDTLRADHLPARECCLKMRLPRAPGVSHLMLRSSPGVLHPSMECRMYSPCRGLGGGRIVWAVIPPSGKC